MKRWQTLGSLLALIGSLAAAPAGAQSLSYGVAVTDFGAPSTFAFSFLTPIVPTSGLVAYSVTLAATLTDGADGTISMTPVAPATSMFTFSSGPTEIFADPLGTITSSFGPLSYTGTFDCGAIGCSDLSALLMFTASGGGDIFGITASITLSEIVSRVPEPATFALLALGLAGLVVARRHTLKRA